MSNYKLKIKGLVLEKSITNNPVLEEFENLFGRKEKVVGNFVCSQKVKNIDGLNKFLKKNIDVALYNIINRSSYHYWENLEKLNLKVSLEKKGLFSNKVDLSKILEKDSFSNIDGKSVIFSYLPSEIFEKKSKHDYESELNKKDLNCYRKLDDKCLNEKNGISFYKEHNEKYKQNIIKEIEMKIY